MSPLPASPSSPRVLEPPAATAPAPAPPAIAEQPLLGVPIALTDYERTLEWMDAMVAAEQRGYVCVANTHTVAAAREDAELREAVLGSSLNVPDGQPLVWAVNALGHRLSDRVYGPHLMRYACERAAGTGLRFYLYGGRDPQALADLARNLGTDYPGLRIVGTHCPPFRPLNAAEEAEIAQAINASGADVVWVGIGVPKQEKWMARMRERLHAPVLVGVGAAFDFHAGLVPQAPERLQRLGLEWLFRLVQEPRRLWKRYLRYNPRFVAGFARQYVAHRRARR